MKKIKLKYSVCAALALGLAGSIPAIAVANTDWDWGLVPYVGVDAQWRNMGYKKDFGANLTKKNYPQGNVYAGLKFNEYVGVELGYERTKNQKLTRTLSSNDRTFDVVLDFVPPFPPATWQTKSKLSAFHANIIGFLPLNEEYDLKLLGALGMARANLKLDTILVSYEGAPAPNLPLNFKQRKWIPRAMLGLQSTFCEQFGVRVTGTWERTSALNNMNSRFPTATLPFRAKPKNSLIFGLGLFYNFK